ncbi:MAG TPA: response regulator transcription factor [Caldilineaceae bacterium]|nr:response regulator transcription factor [Caldilineaceae bacterium]
MAARILVVDDDPMLAELVSYNLEAEGYSVLTAHDGLEGLRLFHERQPDLLVLDIAMPKLSGWEVCRRIREVSETPIIMLTAQGREQDVVRALELGADDYVTKPFRIREFVARVQANLRRARAEPVGKEQIAYQDAYLTVDLNRRRVTVRGAVVKLTPTEYRLLALLVRNKGRVLEFRQILEQVWGFEYLDDIDYLRVYIWHLRRKIEQDPKNPVYLLNELNTGYRFEPQD